MVFELFLGKRYLKAKRKQAFISIITIISVIGVMVGVMALIVVLSVMNGFHEDLKSKMLGVNSHLQIRSYEGEIRDYKEIIQDISGAEGVVAMTPFILSQVMVDNLGHASGAIFKGIDTRSAGSVTDIESMITEGFLSSLDERKDGLPGIVIGKELASQLSALPGDILTIISPRGKLTPLGRTPNSQKFIVTALFNSGMLEYDVSMAYVSLENAQEFMGIPDRITGIEIKVSELENADLIGLSLQEKLGYPFWMQDWKARNSSFYSALELEKLVMEIILAMIVLVAALNIISSLVMIVMEKGRDVAILRTMGASRLSIMTVFVFQGTLVGVIGTIVGMFSGLGICHLIANYWHIEIPTDFYGLTTLPVLVKPMDVMFVTVAAIIISFFATIYPSWYASQLNPVETLRYE